MSEDLKREVTDIAKKEALAFCKFVEEKVF